MREPAPLPLLSSIERVGPEDFTHAPMNRRQLQKLGVPPRCTAAAIDALGTAATQGLGFGLKGNRARDLVKQVVASPATFAHDPIWGKLAAELLGHGPYEPIVPREPVAYRTWGEDIDPGAHAQMRDACRVPSAVGAALMPDAHVGYGLPIGGVLACEGAVIPYAVGVDIACRMKLSVLDMPAAEFDQRRPQLKDALERGTRFGVGVEHRPPQSHEVMDRDWSVTRITREKKDSAWRQLGTSGSGNHFVEFGLLTLAERDGGLGLGAGEYVALLSHSGSRGGRRWWQRQSRRRGGRVQRVQPGRPTRAARRVPRAGAARVARPR